MILPQLAILVTNLPLAQLADVLRRKRVLSTVVTRKIYQSFCGYFVTDGLRTSLDLTCSCTACLLCLFIISSGACTLVEEKKSNISNQCLPPITFKKLIYWLYPNKFPLPPRNRTANCCDSSLMRQTSNYRSVFSAVISCSIKTLIAGIFYLNRVPMQISRLQRREHALDSFTILLLSWNL